MKQTANNWASPDSSKNITLAEADQFRNQLAAALAIQFADRFVRTTTDEIISEAELRANQFISPLPVNLWGHLAGPVRAGFNVAALRASFRDAAQGDNPFGDFETIVQNALPGLDLAGFLSRIPVLQQALKTAMSQV
jgi:hypothetical protein